MDIVELHLHRKQLFEVIEEKVGDIYHATRSKKHTEEIREYVLVLLLLCREYLESHRHHFLLRRKYPKSQIFGHPLDSFIESTNIGILFPRDTIQETFKMKDIHMIRRHFAWLFRKILEVHALLEQQDAEKEFEKRYISLHGIEYLRPRRRGGSGGGKLSSGASFGTRLDLWSGISRARSDHDCDRCPFPILKGERYEKEVIRMGEGVEVWRSHISCPEDPHDPRRKESLEDEHEGASDISERQAA